jgi:hypothetical protein
MTPTRMPGSPATPPTERSGARPDAADDGVKGQVADKAQLVQDKANETAGQAQARLRQQVDERSTQAGEQASSAAEALRMTSDHLREQGKDGPAKATAKVAEHAERVGSYLIGSDADRLLGDAEDFGRRKPAVVAAVGVAVGFAASRFLKASSRNRHQSRVEG